MIHLPSNGPRPRRRIGPALLAAAGLAALGFGCSKPVARMPAPSVLVASASLTNLPMLIEPTPVGHVIAIATVTVHSQIGGLLSQVHFQEGQEVAKGQRLFTIDPRPARAALARDKAQLENAEAQFKRDQDLFNSKIESQDQFDTSRANRDALAATVQTDELNLSFTEIRAPFDGVTGALQKHEGDVIKAPDDTLVVLNQIHPIYVQFTVPEQFLPEIRSEMRSHELPASVYFENMSRPAPQGKLTFIDNSVDPNTGTIQLRATFANQDNVLWPGQFVRIALTLQEITNAVVVPTQAVQTGQNGEFIYVLKSDQTAEERAVVTGIAYDGMTQIRSGIAPGETVVTDGQLRLAPGVKVTVKSSAAANSLTNSVSRSSPTHSGAAR